MKKQPELAMTGDYPTDIRELESTLRVNESYDVVSRHVIIGGREARCV